ncbi:MAG: hypothetical protein ACLPPF_14530 [Rhodomicrobium sp.]
MTILRGLAILVALVLIAPRMAEAGAASGAELSHSQFVPVGDVLHGGRCPRLCVEWFDGCNNCTCGKGRIDVCTERVCRWHRRPRCVRHGF